MNVCEFATEHYKDIAHGAVLDVTSGIAYDKTGEPTNMLRFVVLKDGKEIAITLKGNFYHDVDIDVDETEVDTGFLRHQGFPPKLCPVCHSRVDTETHTNGCHTARCCLCKRVVTRAANGTWVVEKGGFGR